jgi:hypothetical protein
MATQKQVETIRIGAFYFNGAYRAFHTETNSVNTYPISLPVWEAQFTESLEFVSGSVTQALTGNERGNISGYRANVDIFLDNSYPAESTKIRTLLEKFANQYDRTVLQTSKGTVTATTVVLVNGVGAGNDNYYKNLTLINASNTDRPSDCNSL